MFQYQLDLQNLSPYHLSKDGNAEAKQVAAEEYRTLANVLDLYPTIFLDAHSYPLNNSSLPFFHEQNESPYAPKIKTFWCIETVLFSSPLTTPQYLFSTYQRRT